MERFLGAYSNYVYSIVRIIVGLLFACHGAKKVLGAFGGMGSTGEAAPLFLQIWFAGAIELTCGLMIAVGLLTSYAAFIASGEMAVAYFQVHFQHSFWPILNRGELSIIYSFVFLYIASRGACILSFDTFFRKSKTTS